jgi:hypothetical protein
MRGTGPEKRSSVDDDDDDDDDDEVDNTLPASVMNRTCVSETRSQPSRGTVSGSCTSKNLGTSL